MSVYVTFTLAIDFHAIAELVVYRSVQIFRDISQRQVDAVYKPIVKV